MSSNLNCSRITMNSSIFLPFFSEKFVLLLIYTGYAYFKKKKLHYNLLLRNLSWNDIWLTNIQNSVCHPDSSSKMTANTVNRLIQWHLPEKVFMKFRSQIENQVSDYRLLWASSFIILTLWLITLTANCKDHEHTHGCALDLYSYPNYVSLVLLDFC